MKPSGKISTSSLGIFCLSVLFISPHFDLAQAAPAEYPNSYEDHEDSNSIEQRTERSNSNSNSSVPGEARGGYFEGDMVLPELAATSGIRDESRRWPKATVIYQMGPNFTSTELSVIARALKEISDKTCVQFKARADERNYVRIVRGELGSGCFSYVGYVRQPQVLNLEPEYPDSPGSCIDHGTVVHEMLHTLGFHHEQSRTDRDDFVTLHIENIRPDAFANNFQKYDADYITDFNVSYDYNSIMHYGAYYFAVDPQLPTISAKKAGVKQLGQRVGLSEKDVLKVKAMYCKSEQKVVVVSPLDSEIERMRQQMAEFQDKIRSLTAEVELNKKARIWYATNSTARVLPQPDLAENQEKLNSLTAKVEQNKKATNSYSSIPRARLYSKPNFSSIEEFYNLSPQQFNPDCNNLQKISRNVKSIQTFDSCVRLYSKRDCAGSTRPFLPGLNDHKNILDFEAVSVGPCFETPHFGRSIETLRKALDGIMSTTSKARLYSQIGQTGEVEEFNIEGFINVPCKNLTVLAGKVKSVDNLGRCVRLFSKSDCTGTAYKVTPLTPIETRDNILSLATKGVASVGPCWELPHGEHSLNKLKRRLDKTNSTS